MDLKLFDKLCCRTPVFIPSDKLIEKWVEFKSIVMESSLEFYRSIEKMPPSNLEEITNKVDFTLWKYYNRARFRATPYGRFASVASLKISDENKSTVILSDNVIIHRFIDWTEKDAIISNAKILVKNSSCFFTNSTVYGNSTGIRYVRIIDGIFETSMINSVPAVDAILNFCYIKRRKDEIFELLNRVFGLNELETRNLLAEMLAMQLIHTNYYPNIIGNDYFKRLGQSQKDKNKSYLIAERTNISGGFNSELVKNIPGLIDYLSHVLPDADNNLLVEFRKSFLKKFDQKMVPLMIALDTELGVGYGNLSRQPANDKLIDLLTEDKDGSVSDIQINYSQLHIYLLNELMIGDPIRLEKFKFPKISNPATLPNSLSVQFTLSNNNPIIENIGGCTANALLGRFTLASKEFECMAREISTIEEKANPGICFFDIAYQAENNVDNINRRKQLYSFELPILSWSCNDAPLQLSEIFVGVINSEIVLWSKKLNKRMVPRLSSAYNYNRSDLPLYRFLCDLQHQGIKSDLNFKLQRFFPGLKRYPRILYKDIIVSPASWLFPKSIYQCFKIKDIDNGIAMLQKWLNDNRIDFLFKAGNSDQLLYFNPLLKVDIQAFFYFCIQHIQDDNIYIFETLAKDQSAILNETGKPYAAEIILNYFHSEPIYKNISINPTSLNFNHSSNAIYPGGEWLYFELYCHPSRTNEILINKVSTLLDKNLQILSWFFIRYNDPAAHVRVRFKLKDKIYGYQVIEDFQRLLEPACTDGTISDIQIKTYFKETIRYGVERMAVVEDFFSIDSIHALRVLQRSNEFINLYKIALTHMYHMVTLCFKNEKEQISFVSSLAEMFTKEFDIDTKQFKVINSLFKEFQNAKQLNQIFYSIPFSRKYHVAFNRVLKTCKNNKETTNILADLLHLHINRLFINDQRAHEAVLYHYLLKLMKVRQALVVD